MSKLRQSIRESKFVITYGPGAILESPYGPRIIPLPDRGFFRPNKRNPEDFEIREPGRFEKVLRDILQTRLRYDVGSRKIRICRIPTSEETSGAGTLLLYKTKLFPGWALCTEHWILYDLRYGCPECKKSGVKFNKRPEEAIRFVLACPNGHLDDVDWPELVHHKNKGCPNRRYFEWKPGGKLSQIEIICPECGAKVNLGYAYYKMSHKCTGRYPEREDLDEAPYRPRNCNAEARIIQRQASNLRITEIISLFTVPPPATELHDLLSITPIRYALRAHRPKTEKEFKEILNNLQQVEDISESIIESIMKYEWKDIKAAIDDLTKPIPSTLSGLLEDEFDALLRASKEGYPPYNRALQAPVKFYVDYRSIREKVKGPMGHMFRVVPISRLHTIIVQVGYRRLNPHPERSRLVPVYFERDNDLWFIGTEFYGEGIFITLDENDGMLDLSGKSAKAWLQALEEQRSRLPEKRKYSSYLFRDPQFPIELHPAFVWWHTLSHLLIRALSIDSGYSAASIRERVYLKVTDGGVLGGIVLYTVQPGADGTLGGLISLVDKFEEMLARAYELALICSNDPLCYEQEFKYGMYVGSACYACLFVSETSCEHRNMWLDRHLLLENPP